MEFYPLKMETEKNDIFLSRPLNNSPGANFRVNPEGVSLTDETNKVTGSNYSEVINAAHGCTAIFNGVLSIKNGD